LIESPAFKDVLDELDNFQKAKYLESRAAVLEYIVVGSGKYFLV